MSQCYRMEGLVVDVLMEGVCRSLVCVGCRGGGLDVSVEGSMRTAAATFSRTDWSSQRTPASYVSATFKAPAWNNMPPLRHCIESTRRATERRLILPVVQGNHDFAGFGSASITSCRDTTPTVSQAARGGILDAITACSSTC